MDSILIFYGRSSEPSRSPRFDPDPTFAHRARTLHDILRIRHSGTRVVVQPGWSWPQIRAAVLQEDSIRQVHIIARGDPAHVLLSGEQAWSTDLVGRARAMVNAGGERAQLAAAEHVLALGVASSLPAAEVVALRRAHHRSASWQLWAPCGGAAQQEHGPQGVPEVGEYLRLIRRAAPTAVNIAHELASVLERPCSTVTPDRLALAPSRDRSNMAWPHDELVGTWQTWVASPEPTAVTLCCGLPLVGADRASAQLHGGFIAAYRNGHGLRS